MSANAMNQILARTVPVTEEAGDRFTERIAVYAVHNRWLRLALAACCVVIVLLVAAGYKVIQTYANVRPLVIRINDVGQPMVSQYTSLEYQPREPEVRYFLTNFVVDHYSRIRATRRDAFQRQLYFMDASHSRASMEEETNSHSIQKFVTGSDDEVDVRVRNVTVEELRTPPFKARVEFDEVYLAAADHRELKTERYVSQIQFTVMPAVPNSFVTVNPLGLVVTYFRDDQAFQ